MLKLFCALLVVAVATSDSLAQRYLRRIIRANGTPKNEYANMQEGTLAGPLAFTANDLSRMFVDSKRLEETPNTLWNVISHEYAHTQGATHNDGSPEMKYVARQQPNGQIIEDDFRL